MSETNCVSRVVFPSIRFFYLTIKNSSKVQQVASLQKQNWPVKTQSYSVNKKFTSHSLQSSSPVQHKSTSYSIPPTLDLHVPLLLQNIWKYVKIFSCSTWRLSDSFIGNKIFMITVFTLFIWMARCGFDCYIFLTNRCEGKK